MILKFIHPSKITVSMLYFWRVKNNQKEFYIGYFGYDDETDKLKPLSSSDYSIAAHFHSDNVTAFEFMNLHGFSVESISIFDYLEDKIENLTAQISKLKAL